MSAVTWFRYCRVLIAAGISYAVTYGRDEPISVLKIWGMVKT